jgi:hypothetical protein
MLVTPPGSAMLGNHEHQKNARAAMLVTPSPIVAFVRLKH